MAYRRAPEQLGALADDVRLSDAMDQLAAFVGETSCLAVSVDGRSVTAHNAATAVIPASTHKLLVASVALDVLGPEHRFTTSVVGPGPVDGVIDGDLVLVGGGDPLLVSADYPTADDPLPEFNTTSLDVLADQVVAAGVTVVNGAVLGDGSRYDDAFVNPAWGPDVAFVDAGPYDALVVNDARTLGGSGRQGDPNDAAASEFARLLSARGVAVGNGSGIGVADPGLPVLASIQSEPLAAILEEMLTTSDNDTAEMLLKELGVADSGEGTVAAGLNVVDRTLRGWGVPMDGVRLVDASGLSSDNRLTCAALLRVLQRSRDTAVADGLAIAGRTGTLSDAFIGTAMEGRLVAKTGTLGNPPDDLDPPAVKGLAGYFATDSGSTIEYVLILNAPTIDETEFYEPYWLALGERLAAYPAGPDRAAVGPRVDTDG
jgi:D-alanyl-D-alanine carboxypeptidase/D-alanyl-D-alanine-endopeptidase (penicillin-binding protein 4)